VLRRTAGDPDDGLGERGGAVFGDDDGIYACGVGRAQTGTEVVGILHLVEDEDEGGRCPPDQRGEELLGFDLDFVGGIGVFGTLAHDLTNGHDSTRIDK